MARRSDPGAGAHRREGNPPPARGTLPITAPVNCAQDQNEQHTEPASRGATEGSSARRYERLPFGRDLRRIGLPRFLHKRDISLLEQLAIRLDPTHHRCMNTYSEDPRKKIVEAKQRGLPTPK